jgi:hypothetical protein
VAECVESRTIEAVPARARADLARWISLTGAIWVLALYFMCRPYRGVRHDAQIYFGQALLRLSPEWMSHDLFFQYGSQDRYSIFSTLFAPVLRVFGVVQGEIGALLSLHALFWVAAWCLVRRVQPSQLRWFMLAVVALMPHFYGGAMTFSFQEPFLTARSLAEPFCIFAIAAIERGRPGWALACLVLALVSHPLIAIPAWALVWYLLCERDRRWLWAGLGLSAPLLAGSLGVVPFDGLFKRYDAAWYEHVFGSNGFDFMQTWGKETWSLAGFDLAFLTILSSIHDMPLRRLYRGAVVVGMVLLALSALLVDGLHLVLPTQLQLWRVMWIVHLLALLGLYPGLAMLWRRGPVGHLAAAAIALAAVIVNAQAQTGGMFAAAAVLIAGLALRRPQLDRRIVVLGIVSCVVAATVMGLIQAVEMALLVLQGIRTGMPLGKLASIPSAIPQLMLALTWLVLIGAVRSRRRWALPAGAAFGLVALAWSITAWDQRDDWALFIESHYDKPSPFGDVLRPGAQVYWPNEMLASWVLLRRPNYISIADEAGAVFNRQSTVELDRRKAIILPMRIQTEACVELALQGRANYDINQCGYTDASVRDVCRSPGAPDNVVLMNPLQAPPRAVWRYQAAGSRPEPYYLYDCHSF